MPKTQLNAKRKTELQEYALAVLESLMNEFPDLLDTDTPVSGADLTEGLLNRIHGNRQLVTHLNKVAKG